MASEDVRPRPSRPPQPGTCGTRVTGHSAQEQVALQIRQLHDEAYLYIEQGLTCDEKGRLEQAVTLYTKGLRSIDQALTLPHASVGSQQDAVNKMVQKMMRTKAQIQGRVEMLINTDAGVAYSIDDPPPSYECATTPTPSSDFDMLLDESLGADQVDAQGVAMTASASELFKIGDGVQIFFITPEGYVSAPSYPSSLGVYKFLDQVQQQSGSNTATPPAFLKVGDWTYPLVPGCSPVLHANWGSYVFPDTNGPEGSAIGVIIPDNVSAADRLKFERTLESFTALRHQHRGSQQVAPQEAAAGAATAPPRPQAPQVREQAPVAPAAAGATATATEESGDRTSRKLSQGIVTAAEWISWGLTKGAEKTGQLLKKGSNKLQETLKPEDEASKINPNVQKGAYYARQATHGAVQVSGFLVQKLGQGTAALARYMAPHLRRGGEKLLPASMTQSTDGRSKLDDVVEVAAGGVRGWATVYVGLETAAKALAKSLADETVNIVQHKYGPDAGKLTENTVYSVTNVAVTANTMGHLGPKAVARRVAKDAGKAVVDDGAQEKKQPPPQSSSQTAIAGAPAAPSTSHSQGGATARYSQRNGTMTMECEKGKLPQ